MKQTICFLKLPASEKNLSKNTENDHVEKYFLAKLAIFGYFVLFKFDQFKTLASSVSTFKQSVAKNPLISALNSLLIRCCCSFICVAVLFCFKKEYLLQNLFWLKFAKGYGFGFFDGSIGE